MALTTGLLLARVSSGQRSLGTVDVEAERLGNGSAASADDPPFVTIIDARQPSARVVSVADLVEEQAGVHVRSRGGLGAFTSVSVRGSEATEVAIFIDGVPLNRATSGAVDLASIPADGLERVEIYRGVPPIELGADAIGGAINLVTRRASAPGSSVRAAVGGGSFGARSASVGWSASDGSLRHDVSASYRGADGDFLYYDNQGTVYDTHDDFLARRRNNGFDQVSLDALVGRDGATSWEFGSHGFLKRQGVPGFGSAGAETTASRLDSERVIVEGSVRRRGNIDLRAGAHATLERTAFTNLLDEHAGTFGPANLEGLTFTGGIDARADATLGTHQLWTLLAEARAEHYQPHDLLQPSLSEPASLRLRAALAISDDVRLLDDRVALSPALRVDGIDSRLSNGQSVQASQATGATTRDLFLSPRIGARARLLEGSSLTISLKGSLGRFVRLPSVLELFGDGAFILPRPSLRPEVAVGGDLGVEIAGVWRFVSARVEAAYFGRSLDDTIVLQPSARGFAAINIGSSTVQGCELRARARVGRYLAASVEYTLLDAIRHGTQDVEGKQLPNRARNELGARVDLTTGPFALFYDVHFLDAVWRDAENYNQLPARWLHAAGGSFGPARGWPLTLTVEVRNLLDVRVVDLPLGGSVNQGRTTPYPLVDVFDYPLPGRAIYVTLALRT